MEVLQCSHTLESRPVSEPSKAVPRNTALATERLLNECFDCCTGLGSDVTNGRTLFEFELRPHDKMDNIKINTIGPVVVEGFVVGSILERDSTKWLER